MATKLTGKGRIEDSGADPRLFGAGSGSRVVDGTGVTEKSDGPLRSTRFAKARGSAGPGPTTDELMALLRGEPE